MAFDMETVSPLITIRLGLRDRFAAVMVCVACAVRGIPLFFLRAPATPLRVLCIMALQAVYRLRSSRWMSAKCIQNLATALDYAALRNAQLDGKRFDGARDVELWKCLESAGLREIAARYQRELMDLEGRRPAMLGDADNFRRVAHYRSEVVELSIRWLVQIIHHSEGESRLSRSLGESDDCVAVLCRMALVCQVIDDTWDYSRDRAAGLPSFLTATASFSDSLALTHEYLGELASPSSPSRTAASFPFRIAFKLMHGIAALTISLVHSWTLSTWRASVPVLLDTEKATTDAARDG
jgi:hypothetical protein